MKKALLTFILFVIVIYYYFNRFESKKAFKITNFITLNEKLLSKRIKNIYFLKTHKTGGSAVNNVLHRLAVKFKMKNVDNLKTMKKPKFEKIFFGRHSIHRSTVAESIFPRNDSLYITILRNPVDQFLSRLNYRPNERELLENYFRSFYHKSNNLTKLKLDKKTKQKFKCLTRNLMSHDLGYVKCGGFYNGSKESLIRKIKKDFDLVLLNEYFDEGMILLKKILNISYEDVVCLSVNEGTKAPSENQRKLVEEIIPKMSNADFILYNYWKKEYEKISPYLRDEVKKLKFLNKRYQKRCTKGRKDRIFFADVPFKAFILKKNLPKNLAKKCWLLTRTNEEMDDFHSDLNFE